MGSKLPPIPDPPCHHTSVSGHSYISIRAFIHQYPGLHTSVSGILRIWTSETLSFTELYSSCMATCRYDISCNPMIISLKRRGGGEGGEGGWREQASSHPLSAVTSYISIRAFIRQYPGILYTRLACRA